MSKNSEKNYTEDWFSNNIPTWKKYLGNLRDKPAIGLEIGSFEGFSSNWILNNLLTHSESKLYCIDHWLYKGEKNNNPYKTFLQNISEHKKKVKIFKDYSSKILRKLNNVQFDFIYIDANRHSQNVLEDAVLSFPLLKPDGIMIFDDYTYNKEHNVNCPRPGIDAFINIYVEDIKVLHTEWQVIIKKRKIALKRKPCYSEYYSEPSKTPTIYRDINKYK